MALFLRKTSIRTGLRRLSLAVLAMWLGSGCILAPDIEEELQPPNYPPEIVISELQPPDQGIVVLDSAEECLPMVFEVGQVKERNINDDLQVGWFLDFDPIVESERDPSWSPLHRNGEVLRPGPDRVLDLSSLEEDRIYTYRVIIIDRPADITSTGIEFPNDPDGGIDAYQWTFQVSLGVGYCSQGGSE